MWASPDRINIHVQEEKIKIQMSRCSGVSGVTVNNTFYVVLQIISIFYHDPVLRMQKLEYHSTKMQIW